MATVSMIDKELLCITYACHMWNYCTEQRKNVCALEDCTSLWEIKNVQLKKKKKIGAILKDISNFERHQHLGCIPANKAGL